jgi:PKD repeat protein
LTVSFNGAGSSDPDGSIASYAWDLDGDGQFDDSTAQSPQFTYTTAGSVTVKLRVTDNQGAQDDSDPLTITVTTGGGGTTYAQAVLADSPAAFWRLGDSSGTLADSSGSGRPGIYVGVPSLGVPGALNGDANTAVGFNGTTQYAEVPFSAALNPAQFTVEAWAFATGGAGTYRAVVTSRDSATGNRRGFVIYAGSDNGWQFWLGTGTDSWRVIFGPTVALNTWTHLVVSFDGTTSRLYVNGSLVGSQTGAFAQNTARPLRIAAGASEGGPLYFFPGRVDEVAVYPTVLTDTRIQAHYAASGR